MTSAFAPPAFHPLPHWTGGDPQTLRAYLRRWGKPTLPSGEILRIPVPAQHDERASDDTLIATLHKPHDAPSGKPTLVLLHGLTGSQESRYMLDSAAFWLARGHAVMRTNLRGAGPSRKTCAGHYHAGLTDDVRHMLRAVPQDLTADGVVLMGFSLGGNQAVKLASEGDMPHVRTVVSVSAPLDLRASSERMGRPRNAAYQAVLVRDMRAEVSGESAIVSEAERATMRLARSVLMFDDTYMAPRFGFADAADYYKQCSAVRTADQITVPTLLIQARNDPWIPWQNCMDTKIVENPAITAVVTKDGGHVGFHDQRDGPRWHDRCAATWLEHVLSR